MAVSFDPSLLAHAKISESSPIKKNVGATTAGNAPLHELRTALLQDLDQVVPIVDVQYFQDYILPPLPCDAKVVSRVVRHLRTSGAIVPRKHWVHWEDEPCKLNGLADDGTRLLEDKVFAAFATLSEDVKKACIAVVGGPSVDHCQVQFRCNPSCVPSSINRRHSSKTRPDAYGLLNDYIDPIQWADVVIPGEFKKNATDEDKLDVSAALSLSHRYHS